MGNEARQHLFAYYWLVPIIIFLALCISLITGWYSKENESIWLAFIATGFGWTYFFQKQKLEEDKFFLESFEKFNKRFHDLSDALQATIDNDIPQNSDLLEPVIHKYFDLCLEECQLYKAGRIPEQTWRYWAQGMHYFLQFPVMEKYWIKMKVEKLDDGLTIEYLDDLLGKPLRSVEVCEDLESSDHGE